MDTRPASLMYPGKYWCGGPLTPSAPPSPQPQLFPSPSHPSQVHSFIINTPSKRPWIATVPQKTRPGVSTRMETYLWSGGGCWTLTQMTAGRPSGHIAYRQELLVSCGSCRLFLSLIKGHPADHRHSRISL
ncbi:hypothetical protein BaRGS_00019161 [Batillaria attramentaria]|uniref:Uncharacterized protein n=1 Tax=Batillaria attramentaria TaxID=370345 RepID=A0ABD0KQK2_9CAEN